MISLHRAQSRVFADLFLKHVCRFAVCVCARGWGKSFFGAVAAWTAIRELMALPANVPNKVVYIVAPTFDQVKDIYFPMLAYTLGITRFATNWSQDRGFFDFPNNVSLRLVSYEAIDRLLGKGAYFIVLDEVTSWSKGQGLQDAWERVVEPGIRSRWSPLMAEAYGAASPGRALIISTPKGYDYLHTMFHFKETDPEWKSYQYDYTHSPYLDPRDIEKVKDRIDPIEWASQYLAQFKDSGNSVFYNFNRDKHVRIDIPDFFPSEDVHVGIDFNVGIMAASAFARRSNQQQYIRDFKGAPNTPELIKLLRGIWPENRIITYPDPTGKSASTSTAIGQSDLSLLAAAGFVVLARDGSPKVVDSVQATNRRLLTASGHTSMYFHPRCADTINSMERTTWLDKNVDAMVIDKRHGVEHWSDEVRYATEYLHPVNIGKPKAVQRGQF